MAGVILAGVDNTNTALGAAEKAAGLAIAFDAELHIVSAYSTTEVSLPRVRHSLSTDDVAAAVHKRDATVEQLRQGAQAAADSVVEYLQGKFPNLRVEAHAVEGAPGPVLIAESKNRDADMVVVGNRNVQGAGRILGSIATTVAREIECDLYIVYTRKK